MVNVKGGFWGTAVADHDRQELILTKKYYALGQFTRYIRPGSRLIEMSGSAVAALNRDGDALTVVCIHAEEREWEVKLDISRFGNLFPDGSRVRIIRTSGSMAQGENWAELPESTVSGGCVTALLPPFSITTFLVEGNGIGQ